MNIRYAVAFCIASSTLVHASLASAVTHATAPQQAGASSPKESHAVAKRDCPNLAAASAPTTGQSSATKSSSGGKTRAEVQRELVQAQHDGVLPFNSRDYPPGANTVARNKELHALTEPPCTAH